MKFCPKCETKLSQNHKDLGAPLICPKCNPEKIVVRKPTYGVNYSGRTNNVQRGAVQKFIGMKNSSQIAENLFLSIQEQTNHIVVTVQKVQARIFLMR